MEGHSSRLEQAEDIISEHEDEMVIKGKTEELLKEYTRTHRLHQKTKPKNHEHLIRRKGASKRNS
jgi:hypothetical protein